VLRRGADRGAAAARGIDIATSWKTPAPFSVSARVTSRRRSEERVAVGRRAIWKLLLSAPVPAPSSPMSTVRAAGGVTPFVSVKVLDDVNELAEPISSVAPPAVQIEKVPSPLQAAVFGPKLKVPAPKVSHRR